MKKAVARSAYEKQRKIERQEEFVVGVNCFNGPHEIDVQVSRTVEEVYSPELLETAERRKCESLARLKQERDGRAVREHLDRLKLNAADESKNLMPDIVACVKSYATLQEICDVLREVFGEAQPTKL
jgi:methylmalonyl-CoA mutase N-terminal domain/subunit